MLVLGSGWGAHSIIKVVDTDMYDVLVVSGKWLKSLLVVVERGLVRRGGGGEGKERAESTLLFKHPLKHSLLFTYSGLPP